MPDGSVGEVYLDLVVRDTVDKQVSNLSSKATSSAKKSFVGLESTIGAAVNKAVSKVSKLGEAIANGPSKAMDAAAGKIAGSTQRAFKKVSDNAASLGQKVENSISRSFGQAVSNAYAKVMSLEQALKTINSDLDTLAKSGLTPTNSKEVSALVAERERIYARLQTARQQLSNEVQASAAKDASAEASAVSKIKTAFSKALSKVKSKFSSVGKSASQFGTRLKSIIGGALIFNGISAALRKMTDYFGKAVSSSDSMKTALANLKGAAATAAAPLIEMLTPAITALTNAAATALSYLTRLLSTLTGKSVSQMTQAAKKIQAAVNATKQALAGFDEIQKLDGGGTSNIIPNYSFQGQSGFLDSVLDYVKQGDWGQIGTLIASKLNSCFSNINWKSVGKGVADGINAILDGMYGLLAEFNWYEFGSGLADLIGTTINNINWKKVPETLGVAIGGFAQMLWGLIEPAWNSVVTWWNECAYEDGEFVIDGLFKGIGDALSNFGEWSYENILDPIMDGIYSIFNPDYDKSAYIEEDEETEEAEELPKTSARRRTSRVQRNIQVPALATGGTIKQPTLAMLGEYAGARSNPEIAAPQSMIEQSVAKVLYSFSGDMAQGFDDIVQVLREILEAVLGIQIGDDVIGNAVNRYNSKIATARGTYV